MGDWFLGTTVGTPLVVRLITVPGHQAQSASLDVSRGAPWHRFTGFIQNWSSQTLLAQGRVDNTMSKALECVRCESCDVIWTSKNLSGGAGRGSKLLWPIAGQSQEPIYTMSLNKTGAGEALRGSHWRGGHSQTLPEALQVFVPAASYYLIPELALTGVLTCGLLM